MPWPMRKCLIGCVIVKDGERLLDVATTHERNRNERSCMRSVMAIEEANQHEESWRLLDTTLFVTIEPLLCVVVVPLTSLDSSSDLLGDQSEVRWSRESTTF